MSLKLCQEVDQFISSTSLLQDNSLLQPTTTITGWIKAINEFQKKITEHCKAILAKSTTDSTESAQLNNEIKKLQDASAKLIEIQLRMEAVWADGFYDEKNCTKAFIYGEAERAEEQGCLNYLYKKNIPYLLPGAAKSLILIGSNKKLENGDWLVPIRLDVNAVQKLGFIKQQLFLPFRWLYPLETGSVVSLQYGDRPLKITLCDESSLLRFKDCVLQTEHRLWVKMYGIVGKWDDFHSSKRENQIALSQKKYPAYHKPVVGELKQYRPSSEIAMKEEFVNKARELINKSGTELVLDENLQFAPAKAPQVWEEAGRAALSDIQLAVLRKRENELIIPFFPDAVNTCIKLVEGHLIIWQEKKPISLVPTTAPYPFGKYALSCFKINSFGLTESDLMQGLTENAYVRACLLISKKSSSQPVTDAPNSSSDWNALPHHDANTPLLLGPATEQNS